MTPTIVLDKDVEGKMAEEKVKKVTKIEKLIAPHSYQKEFKECLAGIEREFGFDHNGRGPNDRYKTFGGPEALGKFLRFKAPFASYSSVAFYNNPKRREDWLKAEYIFDVDAKDIPIRSCQCNGVCEVCLGEALEIVNSLIDTLQSDLGLKNIHLIYSGRGYHQQGKRDLRSEA